MILGVLLVLVALFGQAWSNPEVGTIYPEEYANGFGKYQVGFKVDDLVDSSRTYSYSGNEANRPEIGLAGRPVHGYTWYPAKTDATAKPMSLDRYIEISRGDRINIDGKLPIERALSEEKLKALEGLSTRAIENAPPFTGKYPIIIFGQGLYYENPVTHLALCEYLASHGYVVVTCPLRGTNSPMVMLTPRDLESIVRDLEFILAEAKRLPYADTDKIGLIGFDMGGMAAQILQMRNTEIDAIMTMDAGIIFKHYSGLPANHPSFDLKRMDKPWLHITQEAFISAYRQYLDKSVWGNVSNERYLMLFKNVGHANFTSYGLMDIPPALIAYWSGNTLPNVPVYSALSKFGVTFMNAYLKGNRNDLESLRNEADSPNPDKIFSLERVAGTTPQPDMDELINGIINGDIAKTMDEIRNLKETDSTTGFFDENMVNNLGYRFLYNLNMPETAIEIFKLNVDMYPNSGNAYDSYAEALLVLNRVDEAIECYEKSLQLDPNNENAKKALEGLKKQ